MNEQIAVREVQFERMRFTLEQRISVALAQEMAGRVEVKLENDLLLPGLVAKIRLFLMGREMERVEVRYPADWREAFRERWWPAWAKRRWPIRYVVKEMVARELYPRVAMPDRSPLVLTMLEEGPWMPRR